MKKKKKEYKPDDRICIFYVADRVHELDHIKDEKQLRKSIKEFKS